MARFNSPIVATALLVGIIGCCSAVKPDSVNQWATAASASSYQELSAGLVGDKHEEVPFSILTKYLIRPSIAKEFVTGWLKFREIVKEAKGSRAINLSKPLTNNLVYYSYEEWESREDALRFANKSSAVRELVEYIEEHDIPVRVTQLVPVVPYNKPDHASIFDTASQVAGMSMKALSELIGDSEEVVMPKASFEQGEGKGLDINTRNNTVIILTKFLVKPSHLKQFVKAADLVTKAVAKAEEGNLVYGVSKTVDDDVTFWSYAIWEDEAALKTHLESVYAKKFIEYIMEQDIYFKATPLIAIEQIDE